jgi:hypothetical protein
MAHIERKNVAAAPAPANWHEVRVGSLVVYRNPKREIEGYEEKMVNSINNAGEICYANTDATERGFFAEGTQPEGWVPEQRTERVPTYRNARGAIGNVQIVEEDADGNAIARGMEGYAELAAFGSAEMRELAMANVDTVGIAYDTAVSALQNLAEAIYAAVK